MDDLSAKYQADRHSGRKAIRERKSPKPGSGPFGASRAGGKSSGPSGGLRRRRSERAKTLAFGSEALEERRGLQRGIVGLLGIISEPIGDLFQPYLVGPIHRAATVD